MILLMTESIFRLGSRKTVLLRSHATRAIAFPGGTRAASSTVPAPDAFDSTAPKATEPKLSFHKRVLPANLVAMSSPAGKAMFRESLAGVCELNSLHYILYAASCIMSSILHVC